MSARETRASTGHARSDIAENDNADGPVVVQIVPSDNAFQTSNCADFHKAG